MFRDEFAIDLKTWKKVLYSSLGGGNQITSARLHALQMMVDEERNRFSWEGELSEKLVLMDTLSNLCQFAKAHGYAAEKTIFLHIMIDLIYDYEKRHAEPPRRLQANPGINWDELEPSQLVDEPLPYSSDGITPSADMGDIPF